MEQSGVYNRSTIQNLISQDKIRKNERMSLYSRIYKVSLYSMTKDELPYCILDSDKELFQKQEDIFVIELTDRTVKEIITGEVYPIVNLEHESNWTASKLSCDFNIDKNSKFALSRNYFLKVNEFTEQDLLDYYDNYEMKQQKSNEEVKVKKLSK